MILAAKLSHLVESELMLFLRRVGGRPFDSLVPANNLVVLVARCPSEHFLVESDALSDKFLVNVASIFEDFD